LATCQPIDKSAHATIGSAMQLYQWDRVEKEQMSPSFARQVIHGDTMTVARVYLSQGCSVPEHSHHNEQISMLEQGALRFVIGGVEQVVKAGQVLRIPPHVPHSAQALEDSIAVDLFSPIREDWIRGDDAYLRK
jgi:quercetin dioxygenase-like cupin family protein